MSPKHILYGTNRSPPMRAVRMTLEELKLDYEFKILDPHGAEIQSPEFLKKNPQHTVPIFEDKDGTCIWDSHAIMAYLVRKYGNADSLYPKDFHRRAVVDQRLHYENGVLFMGLVKKIAAIMHGHATKEHIPEIINNIIEAHHLLETFLGDNPYIAGNSLTVADFSVVTSVSALVCLAPLESAKFPKLSAWFERMKKLPYYDLVNAEGTSQLHEKFQNKFAELNKL